MVIDTGYICKKCGKIYHKTIRGLPTYCKKCGADLIKEDYLYNLIEQNGKVVETRCTNIFGGYDYHKITASDNVEKVKLRRKYLFFWELFK